jgi:hypothetical protein
MTDEKAPYVPRQNWILVLGWRGHRVRELAVKKGELNGTLQPKHLGWVKIFKLFPGRLDV